MTQPFKQARSIAFFCCLLFSSAGFSQEDEEVKELIYRYTVRGYENVHVNLDTAEYYLHKALELQYSLPGYEIDARVAGNHVNLASVYRRLYNNSEALKHLNIAEDILNNNDPESLYLGYIYNNKGNIIKSNNDMYRTKQYYEYALDWLIKTGNRNTNDFLSIYSNYIDILLDLNEIELALQKLTEVEIDKLSLTPSLAFDFHIIKAATFTYLEKYDEALPHYQLARKALDKQELGQNLYKTKRYYAFLINYYISIGDHESAYREITKGLMFLESIDRYSVKLKSVFYSSFQYLNAYLLNLEGKYDRSLQIIESIIIDLTKFFEEQSLTELNSKIRNENTTLLSELFALKSRVLFNKYRKNPSLEGLITTYEAYMTTISILNSTKLSMFNEDSRIFATSQILEIYHEAIYVGKLLYDLTGDISYREKSFEFTESSKSFALFSEIRDMEAMEFADLPPDIKAREERFLGEIQAYEEMMYDEQLATEPDFEKIAYYKDKLFHLEDDYNDLKQEIEQNNKKYFELKYTPKFLTLQDVQNQLPYRDAMIEYVLTDTLLITYIIDRKGINVLSQVIGPGFEDECLEFYRLIHAQNFSSGVHDNYRRFVYLGRKLYKVLVEPCLEYTDRQNLTIVPDGAITYLPFEALLTDDSDQEYINYLILPYMIRKFSVGYSHSSTLMFSERIKTSPTENRVLAFAPDYKNPMHGQDTSWLRQMLESDFLLPLPGVLKEVQSINECVPSRIFLKEQATEGNFKRFAPDYNVLHLAMHTMMRDDNPLWSMLAFTNVDNTDTTEDNRLYAYEIYNMKLNARMAVLSSCSSGFGKMQKGEGMMSLARGFIYAGCPSIVMTLWQVSDKSSSDLMTAFYRHLKKGKSKQEAMRLAKLGYLGTADDLTSNPYFWSGFVVLGDSSPIYRKSGISYWALIIAMFVGVIVYVQYRRPVKL